MKFLFRGSLNKNMHENKFIYAPGTTFGGENIVGYDEVIIVPPEE